MNWSLLIAFLFLRSCYCAEAPDPGANEARVPLALNIGVIHEGALYSAQRSLAVSRCNIFGDDLRVWEIGPNAPVPAMTESTDFPPRWKVSNRGISLINADPNPSDRGFHYGFHARSFSTFCTTIGTVEKRLQARTREKPEKIEPSGTDEITSWSDFKEEEKLHNLLNSLYIPICNYVNKRDGVDSEEHPFSKYEFFYDLMPGECGSFTYIVVASESLQEDIERLRKESRKEAKRKEGSFPADWSDKWMDVKDPLKPMLGIWRHDDRGQWELVEKIKDPCIKERFHVFPQGTSYFFVTDTGKVYVAKKPATGERKIEEVWVDKRRPVVGAITDTASGKTFLFAAESDRSAKLCYFELAEKPDPCEFERKAMVDKKLPAPVAVPAAFTFILVADKKIKIETKSAPKPEPKP